MSIDNTCVVPAVMAISHGGLVLSVSEGDDVGMLHPVLLSASVSRMSMEWV